MRASLSLCRRLTAAGLAGALVTLSPGLPAYQAAAQTIASVPNKAGVPSVNVGAAPMLPSMGLRGTALSMNAPVSLAGALPGTADIQPTASSLQGAPSISLPAQVRTEAAPILRQAAPTQAAGIQTRGRAPVRTTALQAPSLGSQASSVARGVPEAGRREKTALGRLLETVKSIPKMMGLGGASLKHEAGRRFDLSGGRVGALGVPAPSFGAPRMLRRAGHDAGENRFPLARRTVQPFQERKFLNELQSIIQPGDRVTKEYQKLVGDEAGLDADLTHKAMLQLMQKGYFLELEDGSFIFTDLGDGTEGMHQQESSVRKLASRGLDLVNDSRLVKRAQGLNLLHQALARFDRQTDEAQHPLRKHVDILYKNATVEVLRDVLKEFKKSDRSKVGVPAAVMRGQVDAVLRYLETAVFDNRHHPGPLDSEAVPYITSLLGGIKAHALTGGPEQDPELERVVAGLSLLAPAVVELSQLEEPEPEADPVEEARKSFKVVSRYTYKKLYEFGSNLTEAAKDGKLHPLIGREREIRQAVKVLSRVEKNNPVFIGEKGVGKTKAVEGLAQLIADGKIPMLKDANIIKVDVGAMIAGTTLRGQFEERLKGVLEDAKKANKSGERVILFIDEIHMIVGLGAAGGHDQVDASNLIKEALANGELSVIGATTLGEFRTIEKNGALERRFQSVMLEPPTHEEAVAILEGLKYRYEAKHGVRIPKTTVEAAVRLAARYVKSKFLPDSALDLMDDAAGEVQLKALEAKERGEKPVLEVTETDIAYEINLRTGIPAHQVSSDDMQSLALLEGDLSSRLIGQPEAIAAVVKAIRRGRLGYKEEKQPVGTFVFLGPTGVGKTELARVLAANQFGSVDNIVRLDMSEFQEKHTVSRLISAPPGYVGYGEGGQLTEPVRRNPHSLILLDEIEKAHPDVLNILLQVIEDGRLTDGSGRTVDFSNTILVLTSNIGGSIARTHRQIGFIQDEREAKGGTDDDSYIQAFKDAVRPEFYNRIGRRRVIVFNKLTPEDLSAILDLRMSDLNKRLAHKKMSVKLSEAARKHLLDEASTKENLDYGARPVKQAIEHEVEDAMVDAELAGTIHNGDSVVVDYEPGKGFTARKEGAGLVSMGAAGWLPMLSPMVLAAVPYGWLAAAVALSAGAAVYLAVRHIRTHAGFRPNSQAPPGRWLGRLAALSGTLFVLDWALKAVFVSAGLPTVLHFRSPMMFAFALPLALALYAYYLWSSHSSEPPLQRLNRYRKDHPVVGNVLYALLQVWTFPIGLSDKRYAGDIASKQPVVGKALAMFGVAAAVVAAGLLGNGLEGMFYGAVVDFIPVGHAMANLSDFFIFIGLPFVWMLLDFLSAARRALESRTPASLKTWKYFALPVLGLVAFILSTGAGYAAVPMAAWVVAVFSILFLTGIFAASTVVQPLLERFNRQFRLTGSDNVRLGPPAAELSAGYGMRKGLASALASVMAFLPFVEPTVNAPRMPAADRAALLSRFKAAEPKVVLMDWDNTFMDNWTRLSQPATPDRLALLRELRREGIVPVFITNRSFSAGGRNSMKHILFDRMGKARRAGMIVAAGGGAEIYRFEADGSYPAEPVVSHHMAQADHDALRAAFVRASEKVGYKSESWFENPKAYEHSFLLKKQRGLAPALMDAFSAEMKAEGLDPRFDAMLKIPVKPGARPYIRVRQKGVSKTSAVNDILGLLRARGMRIEPEDVLMFGDEFGPGNDDVFMARALPGALALAVGRKADPREANVHRLPEVGPDATTDFLWEMIGRKSSRQIKGQASQGRAAKRPEKAWLSKHYKPVLQAGIFLGYALGLFAFVGLFQLTGGLSILALPLGVVAGVLVADRLARGSIERVVDRYQERILSLPGVRGVGVGMTDRGKVVAVYYGTKQELQEHAGLLPELIDGYRTEARVANSKQRPVVAAPEATLSSLMSTAEDRSAFGIRHALSKVGSAMLAHMPMVYLNKEGADRSQEAEGKLDYEDVLFYTQTKEAIDRSLDSFVKQNSGWWSRFTGKENLVKEIVRVFRVELLRGRKPDFEITIKEDGVKKYLRGPNGESISEVLWMGIKRDAGLTEADLQRFLSIAKRVSRSTGASYAGMVTGSSFLGRVASSFLSPEAEANLIKGALGGQLSASVQGRVVRQAPKAWLNKWYRPILEAGIFLGFTAGIFAFVGLLSLANAGGLALLSPAVLRGLAGLALPVLTMAGTVIGDRLARGSVETVIKRYEARILALQGVKGVDVVRKDGRKAIGVLYESEAAYDEHRKALPELIDGYETAARYAGQPVPAPKPVEPVVRKPARRAPKAWLNKWYRPILEIGVFAGFALGSAGLLGLTMLAKSGGWLFLQPGVLAALAALAFVGGIVGGTLIGDRLARGSIESVVKRYEKSLLQLPGVRGARVGRSVDGRKVIAVIYASKAALEDGAAYLPELIDGYETVARVADQGSPLIAFAPVAGNGNLPQALAKLSPRREGEEITERPRGGLADWFRRRAEPLTTAGVLIGMSLGAAASALLFDVMGGTAVLYLPFGIIAGILAAAWAAGDPVMTPKAWLSKRYQPVLQAGIFTGFAAGLMAFGLLFHPIGGLSILFLPAGVLAGTWVGDRLGRGSIESVVGKYGERLRALPGVSGVSVSRSQDGRKVIAVEYESEEALREHSGLLPELVNGYETEARAATI